MNNEVENTNLANEVSDLEPPCAEAIKGGQTGEPGLLDQPTGNTGVRTGVDYAHIDLYRNIGINQ